MKLTKICPYCKKAFITEQNAKKFCRKRCAVMFRQNAGKPLQKHLCQCCGHIFAAERKRKFCTKDCHVRYMRDLGLITKTKIKIPVKITLTDADRQSKAEGVTYGTFVSLHKLR